MNYSEFQQRYEEEADNLFSKLSAMSEDELLNILADPSGSKYNIWKGGDQYQIWNAFEKNGSSKSIRPLFDIVSNLEIEYLVRYHACEALFHIAHIEDADLMGQVQYGLNSKREKVDQQAAIKRCAALLF
ncbi:MAG TPA: hypothetical protein VFV79_08160 [Saprospiraceae bacterium]|nr:hypothetical protein [Saprospiraceae bacterium]